MDRLPTEVLLRCFSHLSHYEKLQALTVCKHWYQTLRTSDLYKVIFIRSRKRFDQMFDFFDMHQALGRQVKTLVIQRIDLGIYSYMVLPSLFPELQKLLIPSETKPITEWNQDQVEKHFAPWAKTMQCIQENGSPIASPALLKTQLCPNLVSVDLGFQSFDNETNKALFISNLSNAPNLAILKTHWVSYTWKDMEQIHKSVPNLRALEFIECAFMPMEDNIPFSQLVPKITPALSMETLSITSGTFFDSESDWLIYFACKYVNMKNYLTTPLENETFGMHSMGQAVRSKQLVEKCTKLKIYKDHAFGLTKDILKAMDTSGVRLESIDLGADDPVSEFKLLCKSDQKNYIESLTLSGQPYCALESEFKPKTKFIKELAKFPNLKHLRINEDQNEVTGQQENRVPLDLILNELKHLETLTMDFALFEVKKKTKKPFDTKLKKLVLIESYLEAAAIKDKEDEHATEVYVKASLPNTDIIWVDYDEALDRQYEHLFKYDQYLPKQ